jgi:hypothetical protein
MLRDPGIYIYIGPSHSSWKPIGEKALQKWLEALLP